MFGILKYFVIMALIVQNLKLATVYSFGELKQMFLERLKDAKTRTRPYNLLHMGICLLTHGPAVGVRLILSGSLEILLNLWKLAEIAAGKFNSLGKAQETVPEESRQEA